MLVISDSRFHSHLTDRQRCDSSTSSSSYLSLSPRLVISSDTTALSPPNISSLQSSSLLSLTSFTSPITSLSSGIVKQKVTSSSGTTPFSASPGCSSSPPSAMFFSLDSSLSTATGQSDEEQTRIILVEAARADHNKPELKSVLLESLPSISSLSLTPSDKLIEIQNLTEQKPIANKNSSSNSSSNFSFCSPRQQQEQNSPLDSSSSFSSFSQGKNRAFPDRSNNNSNHSVDANVVESVKHNPIVMRLQSVLSSAISKMLTQRQQQQQQVEQQDPNKDQHFATMTAANSDEFPPLMHLTATAEEAERGVRGHLSSDIITSNSLICQFPTSKLSSASSFSGNQGNSKYKSNSWSFNIPSFFNLCRHPTGEADNTVSLDSSGPNFPDLTDSYRKSNDTAAVSNILIESEIANS